MEDLAWGNATRLVKKEREKAKAKAKGKEEEEEDECRICSSNLSLYRPGY